MCGCNKNKAQNNARGRTGVRSTPITPKGVVTPNITNNIANNEKLQKQAFRREAIRRARGA